MDRPVAFAHVGSLSTHAAVSALGKYALFLAPLIQHDRSYADLCIQCTKRAFTILDSGALEVILGTEDCEVKDKALLEMGMDLRASEIVCPDCPGDPKGSLIRSKGFIRAWGDKATSFL